MWWQLYFANFQYWSVFHYIWYTTISLFYCWWAFELFAVWAIANNTAANILVHVSWCTWVLISLGYKPRTGNAGSQGGIGSTSTDAAKLLSKVGVPTYTPLVMLVNSSCPTSYQDSSICISLPGSAVHRVLRATGAIIRDTLWKWHMISHMAGVLEVEGIECDVFTTTQEADRTDTFIPLLLMRTLKSKFIDLTEVR